MQVSVGSEGGVCALVHMRGSLSLLIAERMRMIVWGHFYVILKQNQDDRVEYFVKMTLEHD